MRDLVLVERALERGQVGDVAGDVGDGGDRVGVEHEAQPARLGREVEGDDVVPSATSSGTAQAPMQPYAPVTRKLGSLTA